MSCQIYIDNSTGNFFPGSAIRGRVSCIFNSRLEIREIRLKHRGREHTYWTKQESYYDSTSKSTKYRTVHYSGDRKFIMTQVTLRGAGQVNPGKFEYPFEFFLPNECPSSFNTPHGGIRYYLKATVDIPWAPDYEEEVTFQVVSPIDFNKMPNLMMSPTQSQDEKFVCCCCCASGPITLDVYLEREAYILGEAIRIKAHVLNMSNENILALTAKLTMTIKETATSPQHDSKYNEDLLAALHETGVGAHGDRDYDLTLVIPAHTVLPNFATCSLFEQWCSLKVEVELPAFHSDMDVYNSITLGHVPLRGAGISQTVFLQGSTSPPPPPPVDPYPPPYSDGGVASAPYPIGSNGKDLPGVHVPKSMPMPMPMPGLPGEKAPAPYPPDVGISAPYPPGASNSAPYPPGVNVSAPYPPGASVSAPYPPGASVSVPYPPGASVSAPYPPQPIANAPPEEEAPSAPPKVPLANGDEDWDLIHDSSSRLVPGPPEPSSASEPPPPTYHEAIGKEARPLLPGAPK